MLKILNDKSIKYRRFSLIMIGILDKKFLFAIIILTSCNQKIESSIEKSIDVNQIINPTYEAPIIFETEFEREYNLSLWSEFKFLKSGIIVLDNSIQEYLDNDSQNLEDLLIELSDFSSKTLKSDFAIYVNNPEIKGRVKLLDIQIKKTQLNLKKLTKEEGLKELNKIFIFYNYLTNIIESILIDSVN